MRGLLVVAVLMPLWACYLVKVYAWRTILAEDGILNWALSPLGLKGPGFGFVATWLVFSYLWLPYMILPIYAGLERIPDSMLDASGDLGGTPWTTFRRVVLPLAFPAIVAGSIFTFSLTLGDYITPQLVSSTQFIGNVVYANVGDRQQPAAGRGVRDGARRRDDRLPRWSRAGWARSRRSDAALGPEAMAAAVGDRDHARVPLHPADRHPRLRVQLDARAEVAAGRAHLLVVRPGVPQPRRARRAGDERQGRPARDRDRARARHAGLDRRRALPLLRPRGGLVPRRPADRAARASSPAWRSTRPSRRCSACRSAC